MYIQGKKYIRETPLPEKTIRDLREVIIPGIIKRIYKTMNGIAVRYSKSEKTESAYIVVEKPGYYDLKISIRNHPIYTTVDKVFYITDYTGFTNLEESIMYYVTTFDWETKKQQYKPQKSSSKDLDDTEYNLKNYKKENKTQVDMLINIIKKRSNIDGKQIELNSINTLLMSVTHLSEKEKLRIIKESLAMQINKPVHIIPIKQQKGIFITKISDYQDIIILVSSEKSFLTEIN